MGIPEMIFTFVVETEVQFEFNIGNHYKNS